MSKSGQGRTTKHVRGDGDFSPESSRNSEKPGARKRPGKVNLSREI